MADLVDTSDWQKRYGVIENAYCLGRWAAVMENGTVLLRELLNAGGDGEVVALRHRMQLLMAHTLLHGYGDRDAAEDLYDVVRSSDAEPTLRQIAEDGLDLCHQPLPSSLAIEEDEEDTNEETSPPILFLPDTEPGDLGGGRSLATQMPLRPLLPLGSEIHPEADSAPDSSEPANDLGVAADPFGAREEVSFSQQDQGLPVMPWLSERSPAPLEQRLSTLTADVVEEPELIELHQATPSMAEEVDLQINEDVDPATPGSEDGEPEVDGDLRTGLLLVVVG
jgi:hypothetical protein